jgi:ribosome-binding factor A
MPSEHPDSVSASRAAPGQRLRRVNAAIKEVCAETIPELKDPRIGFVTVTDARANPDLSSADVYFTVLAGEETDHGAAEAETTRGLESAAGVLRREVGQCLRMRRTPELRFRPDPAVAHGAKIERLLAEQRR